MNSEDRKSKPWESNREGHSRLVEPWESLDVLRIWETLQVGTTSAENLAGRLVDEGFMEKLEAERKGNERTARAVPKCPIVSKP